VLLSGREGKEEGAGAGKGKGREGKEGLEEGEEMQGTTKQR
jgi:hypothetical protein